MIVISDASGIHMANFPRNQTQLDQDLLVSATSGSLADMHRLLLAGADPLFERSLAVSKAALRGHVECVKLLIPISGMGESSAVSLAAAHGHVECVELLAPVSDSKANALAMCWSAQNGHFECARILAPLADLDGDYSHDLRVAAYHGNIEAIKILAPFCNLSADPEPFRVAMDAGQADAVALFLSLAPTLIELINLDVDLPKARINEQYGLAALLQSIRDLREVSESSKALPSASRQAVGPRL